jgi:hypothetical protein
MSKITLKLSCYFYQSLAECHPAIYRSTDPMVNGTQLNFGKRYEDDLRVISDQWTKLHLGVDKLSNQKS